jgi:hypothetical protein
VLSETVSSQPFKKSNRENSTIKNKICVFIFTSNVDKNIVKRKNEMCDFQEVNNSSIIKSPQINLQALVEERLSFTN